MHTQEYSKIGINFKIKHFNCNDFWDGVDRDRLGDIFRDRLRSAGDFILDFTGDPIDSNTIPFVKTVLAQDGLLDRATFLVENTSPTHDADPQVIYFPRSFYNMSFWTAEYPSCYDPDRHHNISCLNRMSRPHRLYVFYHLLERAYPGSSLISCRGLVDSYTGDPIDLDLPEYQELPPKVQEFFLTNDRHWEAIPGDASVTDYSQVYHSTNHPAYSDCYLNIVTESSVSDDLVGLSEKVCKPLKAHQLFMIVGNKDSMDRLRNMGFECFDRDLDHHCYDLAAGWINRVDQMLDLLDQKYQYLPDIYQKNQSELEHNHRWFVSADFRAKLLQILRDRDLI